MSLQCRFESLHFWDCAKTLKKKDPKGVCEGVTCSQPSLEVLDLHGDRGEVVQDSSLYCFHSAYLWRILNFVSHALFFAALSGYFTERSSAP